MNVKSDVKKIMESVESLKFTITDKWQMSIVRDIQCQLVALYKSTENQGWRDSMVLYHDELAKLERVGGDG